MHEARTNRVVLLPPYLASTRAAAGRSARVARRPHTRTERRTAGNSPSLGLFSSWTFSDFAALFDADFDASKSEQANKDVSKIILNTFFMVLSFSRKFFGFFNGAF